MQYLFPDAQVHISTFKWSSLKVFFLLKYLTFEISGIQLVCVKHFFIRVLFSFPLCNGCNSSTFIHFLGDSFSHSAVHSNNQFLISSWSVMKFFFFFFFFANYINAKYTTTRERVLFKPFTAIEPQNISWPDKSFSSQNLETDIAFN